jgi:hypothetical protein
MKIHTQFLSKATPDLLASEICSAEPWNRLRLSSSLCAWKEMIINTTVGWHATRPEESC